MVWYLLEALLQTMIAGPELRAIQDGVGIVSNLILNEYVHLENEIESRTSRLSKAREISTSGR